MEIYLTEKIGNPELFTGRRSELTYFLSWVDGVKRQLSKSTAILSRRKTGKTALLQRLYNILFEKNDGVVPFYIEIKEGRKYAIDFCCEFLFTFVYQYLACKTRKKEYIRLAEQATFAKAINVAQNEGFDYLVDLIDTVETLVNEERVDLVWSTVRNAPRTIADLYDDRIVQIIDEFQYLNSEICRDKAATHVINDFAAGYMSTAEYRNAPLLIAGSWVGWLRHLLHTMLPSRFRRYFLEGLPEEEAVEMAFRYAQVLDMPITEDIAYLLARLSEGNPFYLSALFYSQFPEKDFTTESGLLKTLEFETLSTQGEIKSTWWEYIAKTFSEVNERHAKTLVIYLSKHRDREISRKELLQELSLDMTDFELEHKLHALVNSDLIEQGRSNFYYRGVRDNIFDKVFRGMYADDIEEFDPQEITNDYQALFEQEQKKYRQLLGKFNYTKGYFAEYLIINQLRFHAFQQPTAFLAMMHNLPDDFRFVEYGSVWKYTTIPSEKRQLELDILARASGNDYSLMWEVKNRDTRRFSLQEAEQFLHTVEEVTTREGLTNVVPVVFSLTGFTQEALNYFRDHGVAWSEDNRWLG